MIMIIRVMVLRFDLIMIIIIIIISLSLSPNPHALTYTHTHTQRRMSKRQNWNRWSLCGSGLIRTAEFATLATWLLPSFATKGGVRAAPGARDIPPLLCGVW